ncbi:hypothetical protein DFS34DRAFT_313544 [Phlyctochytrium arcticum]|nr:hypothetical protein DFS34DRAFT_313544 [Phlyctochytrium arcticum]
MEESSVMFEALVRAVKDEQEKLLWHIVENVPEARTILLKDVVLPIPRSPGLIRILSRCRELLLPTQESPALRWETSTLSDVFFDLIVHSKLRLMEAVVAPIGLDSETQTAAVAALRRICLLTMKLMADGCDTIPKYFARTICTESLRRNEQVLFAIIRDALTGPSYPDGGLFYAEFNLKRRWLGIAIQQGLHDVARSLVPASPADFVALRGELNPEPPSPRCRISPCDVEGVEPLWRSAVKRAIDEGDYVIMELFTRTLDTMNDRDLWSFHLLLQPAFIANDHDILRFFRGIGVPCPPAEFGSMLLTALYHDLDLDHDRYPYVDIYRDGAVAKEKSAYATMESICIYLGISDADWDIGTLDPDEVQPKGTLFVPPSNEPRGISCQGSPCITANYTNFVFSRDGHAMCRDCLQEKFKNAKLARSREAGGNNGVPDEANTDNIRVACNTGRQIKIWNRIFLVTRNLERVSFGDVEVFASEQNSYVYLDDKHQVAQPNLSRKLDIDAVDYFLRQMIDRDAA